MKTNDANINELDNKDLIVEESSENGSGENMLDQIVAGRIKPERRTIRKILFFLMSMLLVVSVLFWWNFIRNVPLRISKETTFLTEPLRQDGKGIDYLGYLKSKHPKEMATDENGIRLLVRSICCRSDYKKTRNDQIQKMFESSCRELGLKPEDLKPLPGENFYSAWEKELEKRYPGAENEKLRDEKYKMIEGKWFDGSWTKEQEEFTRNWVRDNTPALDKMAEAANKKFFIAPILTEFDGGGHSAFLYVVSSEMIFNFRAIARALGFRAHARVRFGDLAGAASDKRAILNLGRNVKSCWPHSLVVFLVGNAIEGMGMMIPVVSETHCEFSESDLRSLIDLARIDNGLQDLENCLFTERLFGLDYVQKLSNDKQALKEADKLWQAPLFVSRLDWNIVARTLIEKYDVPEKIKEVNHQKQSSWLGSRKDNSKKFCESIVGLEEVYYPILDVIDRTRCLKNLQAISLAALLYEKKNGKPLPVFSKDKNGKPLHSWRVLILPWLGTQERELYEKIRLDEPWDSDYNRRFHQCNLPVFRCPFAERWQEKRFKLYEKNKENMTLTVPRMGDTTYSLLAGSGKIVERPDPICWMKPDGEISPETAQKGINGIAPDSNQKEVRLQAGHCGSFHPGGMNVALANGSAVFRNEKYALP